MNITIIEDKLWLKSRAVMLCIYSIRIYEVPATKAGTCHFFGASRHYHGTTGYRSFAKNPKKMAKREKDIFGCTKQ
jgi:hypothetical protein